MIGNIIKEERNKIGLSQEQLAEQVGVSRSAIAKWENDLCLPDVDNIIILSEIFDKSVDYLLDPLKKKKDSDPKYSIAERKMIFMRESQFNVAITGLWGLFGFAIGSIRLNFFEQIGGIGDMIFGCMCIAFFIMFYFTFKVNMRDKYYPIPSKSFLFFYNIIRKIKGQEPIRF